MASLGMPWYGPDLHNDLVFGNRADLVGSPITIFSLKFKVSGIRLKVEG